MPFSALCIERLHAVRILGMDVQRDLISRNLLVRKYTNQMSGDRAAVLPSRFSRERARVRVEFSARNVRMVVKIPSALGEPLFDIPAQLVLDWIVAHHKRSAEIRFPFLEYR